MAPFFVSILLMMLSAFHYDQVDGLSCEKPPAKHPCEKPVCCNKKKNFPRGRYYINLIYDACGQCLGTCPQQLGDPCGREPGDLECDKSWLRCKQDKKNSRCVRKYYLPKGLKALTQKLIRPEVKTAAPYSASLGDQLASNKFAMTRNTSTKVPACEHIKGEKTCQCDYQQEDKRMNSTLPGKYKWCYVGQINDTKNPKDNCFADVKWSTTAGRYWSYKAYNHTYDGMYNKCISMRIVL